MKRPVTAIFAMLVCLDLTAARLGPTPALAEEAAASDAEGARGKALALQKQLGDQNREIAELRDHATRAQTSLDTARGALENLQALAKQLDQQKQSMEAKLGQMSSAWQADLEGRAKAKEKVEAESAAELSSLRAKVEKLEKSIAETRTGAAEAQAAAARLEDENKKLRAALDGGSRAQVAAKPDENRKPAAEPEKPAKEVSGVKTLDAAPKTAEKSAPPPEERPAPEASVATAAPEANAAAEAVAGPGIKQWQLPNGSFYFGEKPRVPGSKLVGVVGNMGTSGDR